jgi:hypothetical protein
VPVDIHTYPALIIYHHHHYFLFNKISKKLIERGVCVSCDIDLFRWLKNAISLEIACVYSNSDHKNPYNRHLLPTGPKPRNRPSNPHFESKLNELKLNFDCFIKHTQHVVFNIVTLGYEKHGNSIKLNLILAPAPVWPLAFYRGGAQP